VEIVYAANPAYLDKRPVWEQAAGAFREWAQSGGQGDVLVFMPGSYEIMQTLEALRRGEEARGFVLLPLHGELPPRGQDAAVARYDRPKIVVATNVAETSLTIDGIRCVIDSGLARIPRYDPHRGINTLLIEKISRASADQRAGRAGRTAPGTCLRLWSREEQAHRPQQELPEVKRLDLAEVVLTLKAAGIQDLRGFRWLEPPEEQALRHAEELLIDLKALESPPSTGHGPQPEVGSPKSNVRSPKSEAGSPPAEVGSPKSGGQGPNSRGENGASEGNTGERRTGEEGAGGITEIGRKMLAFPVHPRYARMLLAAQDYGCVYQACLVAALTQGRDLLVRNAGPEAERGREELSGEETRSDFEVLSRAWEYASKNEFHAEACRRLGISATAARQVGPLLRQFLNIAQRQGLDTTRRQSGEAALRKCILIGFSDRVARRLEVGGLRCELVHSRRGTLARESVVRRDPLFVAAEIREVEGGAKSVNTLLSLATAIDEPWLFELFPEDIAAAPRVFFDASARRVYAEEHLRFRDLAIGLRRVEPPPAEAAARLLADEVLAGRLALTEWDQGVEQWILRLNRLSQWCPELALPPIAEAERRHLVEQLCHGTFSYKDLKDKPAKAEVKSWLSPAQQELVEKHAPERLPLANGRMPKVVYGTTGSPYIAARIQELYGVQATPRIAMGRIPVLLHILAPSMRPVQITQDLAGFWRDHYPRVKQELQRKYPKHEWR
jgi:ATP-dependent helicase HrpB